MNTTIIIIAVAIIAAIVGFCVGTDAGAKSAWKRINEMDTHKRIDLTKQPGTVKVPHHYLTRYVRMDKEDTNSTNDNIEVLEDEGFTVDDDDTDDGIITMTKGIYEPHVDKIEETSARAE